MKMPKLILFCALCLVFSGCAEQEEESSLPENPLGAELEQRWKIIHGLEDSIKEGDLVVRCGNDVTSFMLKDFSQRDKTYSHSGIAIRVGDSLYIVHNMAGDMNPDERMRKDPLDSFLTPAHNGVVGIYRYDFSEPELTQLKTIFLDHYQNALPFDMNFDLETDDKMYCAEVIAKSVEAATAGRIIIPKSTVNDRLKRRYLKMALQKKIIPTRKSADDLQYYGIDDLYLNDHCRQVVKKVFEINTGPVKFPSPPKDSL